MNVNKIIDHLSVTKIIDCLPKSVIIDVIDFTPVRLKSGQIAERVTLDRLLTDTEKQTMKSNKHIIGVDCIASYRYAKEIQKSYFYVI